MEDAVGGRGSFLSFVKSMYNRRFFKKKSFLYVQKQTN